MTESSSAPVTSRVSAQFSSCAGSARHRLQRHPGLPSCSPTRGRQLSGVQTGHCFKLSPRLRRRPEAEDVLSESRQRYQEMQGHKADMAPPERSQGSCVESAMYQGGIFCSISDMHAVLLVPSVEIIFWAWVSLSGGPKMWPHGSQTPQSHFYVGPWRVALPKPSSVDRIGTGDLLMGPALSSPPSGGLPRSSTHPEPLGLGATPV